MNGKTHAMVATTTAAVAALMFWNAPTFLGLSIFPLALIPGAAAGGLKVDMDMENNPEARDSKLAWWIVRHIPFMKKFFSHRGATHTLAIPVAGYMLAYAIAQSGEGWAIKFIVSILIGWLLGYVSHIVVDLFNGKGVPFLWPLLWKKTNIMAINSDTWEEAVFAFFWFAIIVAHAILVYQGMTL